MATCSVLSISLACALACTPLVAGAKNVCPSYHNGFRLNDARFFDGNPVHIYALIGDNDGPGPEWDMVKVAPSNSAEGFWVGCNYKQGGKLDIKLSSTLKHCDPVGSAESVNITCN